MITNYQKVKSFPTPESIWFEQSVFYEAPKGPFFLNHKKERFFPLSHRCGSGVRFWKYSLIHIISLSREWDPNWLSNCFLLLTFQ